MKAVVIRWVDRYLSSDEAVVLLVWLVVGLLLITQLGNFLAPVIASIVLAYLLHGLVRKCQPYVGRLPALIGIYTLFLGVFFGGLVFLTPILGQQLAMLLAQLPKMGGRVEELIMRLPVEYRAYLGVDHVQTLVESFWGDLRSLGKTALSMSLASIPGLITCVLYLILIPLMVFFFLKDYPVMLRYMGRFVPKNHTALTKIWQEVDFQLGRYIRGKFTEALLVGVATYLGFWIFQLQYSVLLAFLVGIAVFVPYVGAVLVTVPVVIVALFQWGLTHTFVEAMVVFGIIQQLDTSVVVPLLFAEAVSLHPVVIVMAVLGFGSLWGLWGMFFAIPLAVFCRAVLDVWPRSV
jgi:putative permease